MIFCVLKKWPEIILKTVVEGQYYDLPFSAILRENISVFLKNNAINELAV
jgi:hypothetical protein